MILVEHIVNRGWDCTENLAYKAVERSRLPASNQFDHQSPVGYSTDIGCPSAIGAQIRAAFGQ